MNKPNQRNYYLISRDSCENKYMDPNLIFQMSEIKNNTFAYLFGYFVDVVQTPNRQINKNGFLVYHTIGR